MYQLDDGVIVFFIQLLFFFFLMLQVLFRDNMSWLNADMEEREEEVWAQEPKNSMRETSRSCINNKELTTVWTD
jgi:hypothetical protein